MVNPLVTHLQPFFQQPFFQWLLATSWQAGMLVCLILLVQKAMGRWIGVRGRYWLWLVLVIRMVMFSAPPSRVSVYNLLPPPQLASYGLAATPQSGDVGPALAATEGPSMTGGHGKAGPAADGAREGRSRQAWDRGQGTGCKGGVRSCSCSGWPAPVR